MTAIKLTFKGKLCLLLALFLLIMTGIAAVAVNPHTVPTTYKLYSIGGYYVNQTTGAGITQDGFDRNLNITDIAGKAITTFLNMEHDDQNWTYSATPFGKSYPGVYDLNLIKTVDEFTLNIYMVLLTIVFAIFSLIIFVVTFTDPSLRKQEPPVADTKTTIEEDLRESGVM